MSPAKKKGGGDGGSADNFLRGKGKKTLPWQSDRGSGKKCRKGGCNGNTSYAFMMEEKRIRVERSYLPSIRRKGKREKIEHPPLISHERGTGRVMQGFS